MPRGGLSKTFFSGAVLTASLDDLEAWMRRAEAGERFIYCEAPDLVRNETSVRVNELAHERLVHPLWERRAGGGKRFFVERSARRVTRKPSPQQAVLGEPATDLIFRELKRAANFNLPCPTDEDLARKAGLLTRDQAQARFRKLVDVCLIESQIAFEGGVRRRVVTIIESAFAGKSAGKHTQLPPKWGALEQAAVRDVAGARK